MTNKTENNPVINDVNPQTNQNAITEQNVIIAGGGHVD